MTSMNPYVFIHSKFEEKYEYLYRKWEKAELSLANELIHADSPSLAPSTASPSTKNPLALGTSSGEVSNNLNEFSKTLELSKVLRGVDRLKLIHLIINTKAAGCCGLDTAKLLEDKCILAYAPLHDVVELRLVCQIASICDDLLFTKVQNIM